MSYRSCVHAALRTASKCCLYKPTHSSRRGAQCTPVLVCTHAHTHTHTTHVHMHAHAQACGHMHTCVYYAHA